MMPARPSQRPAQGGLSCAKVNVLQGRRFELASCKRIDTQMMHHFSGSLTSASLKPCDGDLRHHRNQDI